MLGLNQDLLLAPRQLIIHSYYFFIGQSSVHFFPRQPSSVNHQVGFLKLDILLYRINLTNIYLPNIHLGYQMWRWVKTPVFRRIIPSSRPTLRSLRRICPDSRPTLCAVKSTPDPARIPTLLHVPWRPLLQTGNKEKKHWS